MTQAELNIIMNLDAPNPTYKQKLDAYRTFSESAWGKIVLSDIIESFDPIGQSHTPGDPYTTAFNCGTVEPVMHIIRQIIRACNPDTGETVTRI